MVSNGANVPFGGWPGWRGCSSSNTLGCPMSRFWDMGYRQRQRSHAQVRLQEFSGIKRDKNEWSGREDLNLRPPGPEPDSAASWGLLKLCDNNCFRLNAL